MGVGGLLMEIPTRPQPREAAGAPVPRRKVDAVVLAAGRSSRMGGPNKLLALFDGKPLIRRTVERALASKAAGTVGGHRPSGRARPRGACRARRRRSSHNPRFRRGPGQLAEGRHRALSRTMPPAR